MQGVLSFKYELVVKYAVAFISTLSPIVTIVLRELKIWG